MESSNLTPRTYTTPTCNLIVATRSRKLSRVDLGAIDQVDFTLHIDRPDRDEQDRITLHGDAPKLDRLQQVVSQYVVDLVAQFPLPTTTESLQSQPAHIQSHEQAEANVGGQLYPDREQQSAPPGLMRNLPGLRNSLPQSTVTSNPQTRSNAGISKLLNRWHKPTDIENSQSVAANSTDRVTPQSIAELPTTPYLTGIERSLDHQLHLGNLATTESGAVLTLSAIQLFDLATVLDESTADVALKNHQSKPANFNVEPLDPTTASLSRLPNLPKRPTTAEHTQVYHRTRRSRSSFVSAIPWAAAAAVAVGVPLLLLDSRPNPLKDFTSKVKVPGLEGAKKSAIGMIPGVQPLKSGTDLANAPTTSLPTAWQAQPVQPPKNNTPVDPALKPTQATSKIGIAPLPAAIVSTPGQDLPSATGSLGGKIEPKLASGLSPRSGIPAEVAPNPLNSSQSLTDLGNVAGLPTNKTAEIDPAASRGAKSIGNRPNPKPAKATPTKDTSPQPGQLPIDPISPGKISVSTQPILIPSDLSPSPSVTRDAQLPQNPGDFGAAEGISPPKKAVKQQAKPIAVANKPKPNPVSPTGISVAPTQTFEPFTPVPRNPNLINPETAPTNEEGIEPPALPVSPERPLQSNAGANADATDRPSLQETKRYFQSKWKADANRPSSLQYVIQISGKSGIVRKVTPQGEAATSYLQQNSLIKAGQKLMSPAAAGSSDQKIRVLLEPDGNVDTFIEP